MTVITHSSSFDATVTAVGSVPPTRQSVRLFSAYLGPDPRTYASALSRFAARGAASADALARFDSRGAASADALSVFDAIRTPVQSDGLARFDARGAHSADGLAVLDARQASSGDALSRFDAIKTPILSDGLSRYDARQADGADALARYDAIKTPLVADGLSRYDARHGTSAVALSRFDSFRQTFASALARYNARRGTGADGLARLDARGTVSAGATGLARYHAMTEAGWHVYSRNVATGAETLCGFIPQTTDPPVLTDVALADGFWEIEARPSEFFWDQCRTRLITTVSISAGVIEYSGLPFIYDLEAEVKAGQTFIRWRVAGSYAVGAFRFGLWFGATSPVTISGDPDASKAYTVGQGDYLYQHTQTAADFVAVAAYTPTAIGPGSEIALPWSTTPPASPPDQHATGI